LVALSGGADSLALAAALGFEAPRLGFLAGAVCIDHGLQSNSAEVANRAADQARSLGLEPVIVRRVQVGEKFAQRRSEGRQFGGGTEVVPKATPSASAGSGAGPEAAARAARYAALEAVLQECKAVAV